MDAEAFVPMAEQNFHKRTPARFHLRSRQREERGASLHADLLEAYELLVKEYKPFGPMHFERVPLKAQELNRKMFEGVMMPHKPAPKEPTQAFRLETDRRIQERQASRQPEEPQDCTFHARPVPLHILEDVVEKPAPLKACPMPYMGLPFQPKLAEKSHVEMCPFSFNAREQERLALKEKRQEELRNEEVPKLKAQHLPAEKVAEPTQVEPFQLQIELRGAAKSESRLKQMKEELKQLQDAAVFEARNTIVHKEAQRAHMEEERKREEEERECEEIARLRSRCTRLSQSGTTGHELKKGEVPLNVPKSPNFSNFRL